MKKVIYYLKMCGIMVLATLLVALGESTLNPLICVALAVLYIICIRILWISILRNERRTHAEKLVHKNVKTKQPAETKRAA